MRTLTEHELGMVAGGTGTCTPENSGGNNIGGISDSGTLVNDLVNIYEALVDTTSHIIERVADSL